MNFGKLLGYNKFSKTIIAICFNLRHVYPSILPFVFAVLCCSYLVVLWADIFMFNLLPSVGSHCLNVAYQFVTQFSKPHQYKNQIKRTIKEMAKKRRYICQCHSNLIYFKIIKRVFFPTLPDAKAETAVPERKKCLKTKNYSTQQYC